MALPFLLHLRHLVLIFKSRPQMQKRFNTLLLLCCVLLCIGPLYLYIWSMDLSGLHRGPTALDTPVPKDVWWRSVQQNITIWTVWIGSRIEEMPPSIQTAVESCRKVHENELMLHYRIVTDVDLQDPLRHLGFHLHPSFHLLDTIEKSDYLRGELLHHHGGFYLDADMLCLTTVGEVLQRSAFDVAGAQDFTQYHPWPAFSQNSLGPVRQGTEITRYWHDELFRTMDRLTPQLKKCLERYGDGVSTTIPYPKPRYHGVSICGVKWGELIDYMKPVWLKLALQQKLGNNLIMCDIHSRHLGYDHKAQPCTISHLGTAGPFFKKTHMTTQQMCKTLQVLHNHPVCQ